MAKLGSRNTGQLVLDNFKFMDSWPAWVRWLAVLAILGVTWLWGAYGPYSGCCLISAIPFWGPWALWTAVFLWCCVAAAPRFKLMVASLLGVFSLCVASYAFYPLGSENWRFPRNLWEFFSFLLRPDSQTYAVGLIIASGLAVGGFLQRRGVRFSRFWFAVAVALFTALSVANYFVWANQFITDTGGLTPESASTMVGWFIGREIALTVVAIGGVWALYFHHERKPSEA